MTNDENLAEAVRRSSFVTTYECLIRKVLFYVLVCTRLLKHLRQ